MNSTTIICPHCRRPFEISDAISHQIEDELLCAKTEQTELLKREYEGQNEKKLRQAVENALTQAGQDAQLQLERERQSMKLALDKARQSASLEAEQARQQTELETEKLKRQAQSVQVDLHQELCKKL